MSEQRPDHRRSVGGGEPLDLLARLELLHPKPPGPSLKLRMLRKLWMATFFAAMFGPFALWTFLQWRVHSSTRLVNTSMLVAIPTCALLVISLLLSRRKLGLTDDAFTRHRWPREWQLGALWFTGFLSSWTAVYLILVGAAIQQGNGRSTHAYRATEIEECRVKCAGCRLRASLQGTPHIQGQICVEDVRPWPKVGDVLEVSGYYFDRGMYVLDVRRATAVSPGAGASSGNTRQ